MLAAIPNTPRTRRVTIIAPASAAAITSHSQSNSAMTSAASRSLVANATGPE